ncbi:alpha/beta family hydrolase [Actinopolymorpha pittospori]|uniref:Alpha/beta-hydrolase family hydrolase n=1 Tax=Actinopolymorpha pittospori TaxID=648752 RepID=A0A927N2X2_9ACTN|nr:alpha/beta family hydrolase [Actinopolymorpha pittospori]MBE1611661.1 putative alpha/beta-hydrolase family hydrolase [Actinopolymorpha pittospori]
MTGTKRLVETPEGTARLIYNRARRTSATLVLGHGAGGGPEARDLEMVAATLPAYDVTVIRVEQPWRLAGRRIAPAPDTLDRAWIAAMNSLRTRTPLVVGGRSAGARVACRTARRVGAVGCVALAFPLHPPGRPEKSRVEELLGSGVPTLVVQGERDAFGRPEELPDGPDVAVVPGADHEFRVARSAPVSQEDALMVLVEAIAEWIARRVGV